MVVCAAFGLAVSEAKTEIMCLRTKEMPESIAIFSVEAAGQMYNQMYNQMNEFVYLGGSVNHMLTCPSRSISAYATHGAASESTPSNWATDRALPSNSKSVCSEPRHSRQCCTPASRKPSRLPLRRVAPSPPKLPDSLHRFAKAQSPTSRFSIWTRLSRREVRTLK